ncbi:daunorubicin resistance protein DrrA family ABC transporter ATP-binding protein [Paenibacillus montaniterrae]|uniref:Daunorubicin resistance protein DrrA family ABC transporter ATP-binding protein n=1 Tax=Paenibacillus montaniterrae TaxID=429341 RepID=A0A919YS39_9BACL|nr:ATP-binding cassette domain-containing protein [Paenibacillus montaniterrae]GIP17371.1 daunorubicin resistance protein DrrA family ABC transporter ATP-binding protein [Paenibacillus montaniterrae]
MGKKELAVEVQALKKSFGTKEVLKGLDLSIERGTVYGVLGPNGAGKTTLVNILSTLLRPDGGSLRIFGLDVVRESDAVRRKIGLTGQFAAVDEELSGRDNLVLFSRLAGYSHRAAAARAEQLLAAFNLLEAADRPAEKYSGGMRRRLDIAAAMLVAPELLFLDEPTTGLDPRSRNDVWDIVRFLAEQGTTVLLTTQYLEEADQLADRLAVIDRGVVIAEGTPSELKASVGSGKIMIRLAHPHQRSEAEHVLRRVLHTDVRLYADPTALSAQTTDARQAAAALTELAAAGIETAQFSLGQPSLDEVFLALTGKAVQEEGLEEGMV